MSRLLLLQLLSLLLSALFNLLFAAIKPGAYVQENP